VETIADVNTGILSQIWPQLWPDLLMLIRVWPKCENYWNLLCY